ncbi:MAG: PAS domain-containing sensor histidine kinase, partial [Chitinophagaceae bacterium]
MDQKFDALPCYYFQFNDDCLITYANEPLCVLFGIKSEAFHGKHLNELLTISSRIFLGTHWLPMLHLQEVVNELYITLKVGVNSRIPLLVNSKRVKTETGYLTDCIGIAISGRQKIEDELIAAKTAYEAALSENAQLTSAQHELNMRAEQLSRSYGISERQNTELKQINKVVTHDLQEPMRKLLFFSEQLDGDLEGMPPNTLKKIQRLSSVIQSLKSTLSGLQEYVW